MTPDHRFDGPQVADQELDAGHRELLRELPALAHAFDPDHFEALMPKPAGVFAGAAAEIDDPPAGGSGKRPEQERTFAREARAPIDGAVVVEEGGDGGTLGRHGSADDILWLPPPSAGCARLREP